MLTLPQCRDGFLALETPGMALIVLKIDITIIYLISSVQNFILKRLA